MKSEPVPRVPRRRRPKKRQRNSDADPGRRPKPASYNQSSRHYNERALKQRTLLTDRTHERTVSHINAEKTKFSRTMNRQETDLLNRLMELEACLPKYQSDTETADISKTDHLDKTRNKLPQLEPPEVAITSNCESSSEGPSDKLKTSKLQPENESLSQPNDHASTETPSGPELESESVQPPADPGRLSPVLEASEEDSTLVTPALPSIPTNTSVQCVVCEGNAKQPDTEHHEVNRNVKDVTDKGVRLPQIDQLSEEERAEAKLNPGLPRSLLRARIRKRSVSKLPTSNPKYHVHFPSTEREDHMEGSSGVVAKSRDEKYPLERNGHHLPPIQTDRAYGRRTWPGDAMELVGMNGYTSDIMPKVMQANYSYNTRLYERDGQESGDSLPTVIRSRALIRREQKKPSKDMYVWLGLDSKYQLRLMTNPKSVSHTDKS